MQEPKELSTFSFHDESVDTTKPDGPELRAEAETYEERKVDRRTIMAIVVRARVLSQVYPPMAADDIIALRP